MDALFNTRDVIVYFKGATLTVNVSPESAATGWRGGQAFQWLASSKDELLVHHSDGLYGGLALHGSDEDSDQFTAMTRQQVAYKYVVLMCGGWLIGLSPNSYERYTYASRTGGGPLVPITYTASDRLVLSLRGLLTIENEWTLAGDPRAPNSYYIGFVAAAPTEKSKNYMAVQLSI